MRAPAVADQPLIALPVLAALIGVTALIMSTIGRHNVLGGISFWIFAASIISFFVVTARAIQRRRTAR